MKVFMLKTEDDQYAHLDPFNGWQTCNEWQHAYFFHSLDNAIRFKHFLHWCGQYISENVDFDFTIFRVVSRNVK